MSATAPTAIVSEAPPSLQDAEDLRRLESRIAGWRRSYREARCLREVSDRRLWRVGGHVDFTAYLRSRWDLEYQNAWRLMAASDVAATLEAAGIEDLPENSAQAIELSGLEPEVVVAIWRDVLKAVVKGGRICRDLVAAVKKRHVGAVADVAADGSISEALAAVLELLPEGEAAAVVADAEAKATAASPPTASKVRPEWFETLKAIRSGLQKLEHDADHCQQYAEVLRLLRKVVKLLGAAA